jgi:hypothetical protein
MVASRAEAAQRHCAVASQAERAGSTWYSGDQW